MAVRMDLSFRSFADSLPSLSMVLICKDIELLGGITDEMMD